jgi:ankyrin repeat domain-containing protein 50
VVSSSLLFKSDKGTRFQWVVCQLDMLRRCISVAAIRKALSAGLPKNLNQTYDQILSHIDELHQQDVLKTLQALTATDESLTLEEIVEILAVDLDSNPPHIDPDSRLLDPRSILSMCSSLVTTVKMSRWNTYREKEDVTYLKLAHASVADYLTQPKVGPSQFHFSTTPSRQFLAQCCLTYLLNPEFANGHKSHERMETAAMRISYPFLIHAVNNWPKYLSKRPDDPDDYLEPRTMELLQAFFETWKTPSGGNFTYWVGMLIPDVAYKGVRKTQPLYYAASFGLTDVVRMILEAKKDVELNALGGRAHSTALHVATYRNHIEVVKILLDKGADPNLCNKSNEAPLYWAVINGNHEMQDLLLGNGATDLKGSLRQKLTLQDHLDEMLITRNFKLDE